MRSLGLASLTAALVMAVVPPASAADAPQALPAPTVVRGPQTFVANPNYRAPGTAALPAGADDALARYREQQQAQALRRVQEQAFIKKFGYGKTVTLRARRY